MPFNWRLQLRLAITNFVVVFIGVLVMKILLTPIGAYFFPANTTELTSDNGFLSGKGSSLDNINFSDDSASTVSQEITIGGTPIAATTDAFGRLPDGGKYVELVDKGYSPMHIDLTDGLGELYRVVETVDGQVVYNETFRGEDAEGQYYAAMGNKTLHKRARTPWQVPQLPVAEMYELARKGKNLYTKWMLVDSAEANRLMSICEGVGPDPLDRGWQRDDLKRLKGTYWTSNDYGLTATAILATIKADLETLTVGTQQSMTKDTPWKVKRNINMNLLDQGPSAAVQYVQDKGSFANNPPHAQYSSIFNPVDGIIVVQSMFSPLKAGREPGIVLQKWSDYTFMVWKHLRTGAPARESEAFPPSRFRGYLTHFPNRDVGRPEGAPTAIHFQGEMMKWLNYIVIQNIGSPLEARQAISTCLGTRKDYQGLPRYQNGRVPVWSQRETFNIGHWCYNALLATSVNRGIAWLLIQHKASLGIKVPYSVTIWWPADNGQPDGLIGNPSLLWEIRDANDPSIIPEKNLNEAVWDLGHNAVNVGLENPQVGS